MINNIKIEKDGIMKNKIQISIKNLDLLYIELIEKLLILKFWNFEIVLEYKIILFSDVQ